MYQGSEMCWEDTRLIILLWCFGKWNVALSKQQLGFLREASRRGIYRWAALFVGSFNLLRWKQESRTVLPVAASWPLNGQLAHSPRGQSKRKKTIQDFVRVCQTRCQNMSETVFCPERIVQTPDGLYLRVENEACFAGGAFEKTLKKRWHASLAGRWQADAWADFYFSVRVRGRRKELSALVENK